MYTTNIKYTYTLHHKYEKKLFHCMDSYIGGHCAWFIVHSTIKILADGLCIDRGDTCINVEWTSRGIFFRYDWAFSDTDTVRDGSSQQLHNFNGTTWHNATVTVSRRIPGNSVNSSITLSWYTLGNNTVIIPANSIQSMSNLTSLTTTLIWPDNMITPPSPGMIIAGNDNGGFVNTITQVVSYSNVSRVATIITGNASIADVFSDAFLAGNPQFAPVNISGESNSSSSSFQRASFVNQQQSSSSLSSAASTAWSNILKFLWKDHSFTIDGSASASIDFDPTLSFSPNLYHRIVISGHTFQEVTLVAEGELTVGFMLYVQTAGSLTITPWSYEYSPPNILGIITLPVLNIPLVVNWHVTFGVSLSVSMQESFSMGATDTFNAVLGASYTKTDGFNSISSFQSNPILTPLNSHANSCSAAVATTVGAGITFTMFGITPQLAIDLQAGLQLSRTFNAQYSMCPCVSAFGNKQIANQLSFVWGPTVSLTLLIFSKSWDIYPQSNTLVSTCDDAIADTCGSCYCQSLWKCCPWAYCPIWLKYQCLCMLRYDGKGVCAQNDYCPNYTCRTDSDCPSDYTCIISQNCNPKNQCVQKCGQVQDSTSMTANFIAIEGGGGNTSRVLIYNDE
ncbi:hypothetical protein DFA_05687 [Cavenderia fasciculata]|uniref:Uncharacterized protein n=1 Tax=Cavenderia fasciculata TaxID=261658 RepID=F4PM54_CACFS|nr:uncharacterized protein DFA_05687 [Cavenderia fasciculata]EGG23554.1 hypothetical protein DFA_05687 [Cavenderia fasciculata]|eukprot:XP_004361405.1 hypothetical protein DFA_05687 [Cavenderia fasciculata]